MKRTLRQNLMLVMGKTNMNNSYVKLGTSRVKISRLTQIPFLFLFVSIWLPSCVPVEQMIYLQGAQSDITEELSITKMKSTNYKLMTSRCSGDISTPRSIQFSITRQALQDKLLSILSEWWGFIS